MVVPRQHLPLCLADPVGEIVRIEGRHRGHREDVAVRHVDDDHRTGLVANPPSGIFVEIGVDRQLDGAAAAVGLGIELLDYLAPGRDLDALPAGLATKRLLQFLLEPFLADLDAGDRSNGFLSSFSYSSADAAPT